MQVSISEGAKLAGLDRKTLYKHIKTGRLSATKTTNNQRQVETSELERVYGQLATMATPTEDKTATTGDTHDDTLKSLVSELKLLREEVSSLSRELASVEALPAPQQTPNRKGNRLLNALGAVIGGVGAAVEALK